MKNRRPQPPCFPSNSMLRRSLRKGAAIDKIVWSLALFMIFAWVMGHIWLSLLGGGSQAVAQSNRRSQSLASQSANGLSNSTLGNSKIVAKQTSLPDNDVEMVENKDAVGANETEPSESGGTSADSGQIRSSNGMGAFAPSDDGKTELPPGERVQTGEANSGASEEASSDWSTGSSTYNPKIENVPVDDAVKYDPPTDPLGSLGEIEIDSPVAGEPGEGNSEGGDAADESPAIENESDDSEVVEAANNNDETAGETSTTTYPIREWIATDGRVANLAFVSADTDNHFIFSDVNGRRYRLPFSRFSTEDQKYILELLAEQEEK